MTQAPPIEWKWNKKSVLLEDLDEKQLFTVRKSIENSNNKIWFGNHSDVLLKEIGSILRYKSEVVNEIKRMRFKRSIKTVDAITNGIIKCFK